MTTDKEGIDQHNVRRFPGALHKMCWTIMLMDLGEHYSTVMSLTKWFLIHAYNICKAYFCVREIHVAEGFSTANANLFHAISLADSTGA